MPAGVEAALYSGDGSPGQCQYLDPASTGGLVVSMATLAWTVYQDHKKKHNAAPPVHPAENTFIVGVAHPSIA
ncbi:hypothetical protein [Actinocorallia lasiicapitis]